MKQTTKLQRKALKPVKRFYKAITSKASKSVMHYSQKTAITLEDFEEMVSNSKGVLYSTRTGVAVLLHRTGAFMNVVKFYKYKDRIDLFTDVWKEPEYNTQKPTLLTALFAPRTQQRVQRFY